MRHNTAANHMIGLVLWNGGCLSIGGGGGGGGGGLIDFVVT